MTTGSLRAGIDSWHPALRGRIPLSRHWLSRDRMSTDKDTESTILDLL